MEALSTKIDDGTGCAFDEALRNTLPDGGDLTVITKDSGTESGRAIAMLTFSVESSPGEMARAQTVVSIRLLKMLLRAIDGAYDDEGYRRLC